MRWPVFAVLIVVAIIAHEPVPAAMPRTVRWIPEERLTLHEGDTAIIEVAPGGPA